MIRSDHRNQSRIDIVHITALDTDGAFVGGYVDLITGNIFAWTVDGYPAELKKRRWTLEECDAYRTLLAVGYYRDRYEA